VSVLESWDATIDTEPPPVPLRAPEAAGATHTEKAALRDAELNEDSEHEAADTARANRAAKHDRLYRASGKIDPAVPERDLTQGKIEPAPPKELDKNALFLRAVHDQACNFFGTVLGPDANAAHANHFHLDMAARRHKAFCE
jgi:hypothetical protein